jgi:uncharacterized protein (DUF58 family)
VIADPMEEALPPVGLLTVQDLETGMVLEFDAGGPEARQYARYVANLRAGLESAMRRLELDFVHVRTDRPYVDALVAFFRARAKRMHHG